MTTRSGDAPHTLRGLTGESGRLLRVAPVAQMPCDPLPPEAVRAGFRGQTPTPQAALDHRDPLPRQSLIEQRAARRGTRAAIRRPTAVLGDDRGLG